MILFIGDISRNKARELIKIEFKQTFEALTVNCDSGGGAGFKVEEV